MIDWYRLQGRKSHALLLIIAMSSSSIKLTAGKFVELSISSFGDVSKKERWFARFRSIKYRTNIKKKKEKY